MLGCNESNIIFQLHLCTLGQLRSVYTRMKDCICDVIARPYGSTAHAKLAGISYSAI